MVNKKIKNKERKSILILMLIVFSILIISLLSVNMISALWWNSSFDEMKEIRITGGNITLTNATILVKVPYSSGMNHNFIDVRFVDSSDTNEYVYYPIQVLDNDYALFKIKITTLYSGVLNNTIHMYYNNDTPVSSTMNGEKIYDDLIAYYPMDECSGTNVASTTGLNNGTFIGGVTWLNSSNGLGCMAKIDGVAGSYINLGSSTEIDNFWGGDVAGNYSISIYANHLNSGSSDLIGKGADPHIDVLYWETTTLTWFRKSGSNFNLLIDNMVPNVYNSVNHYVVAKSGGTCAGHSGYMNGTIMGQSCNINVWTSNISNTASDLTLGEGWLTNSLNGTVDEFIMVSNKWIQERADREFQNSNFSNFEIDSSPPVNSSGVWTSNLNTDLELYYDLNEGTGTFVKDKTGQHNGTFTDTVKTAWTTNGKIDGSIKWDEVHSEGGAGYVSVGNVDFLNQSIPLTVSMWVNSTSDVGSNGKMLFSSAEAITQVENPMFSFLIQEIALSDNHYAINYFNSDGVQSQIWVTDNIPLGAFQHVVFIYGGTGNASDNEIWVNGVNQNVTIYAGGFVADGDTMSRFYLGSGKNYYSQDGQIDEVGVWTRELDSDEISQLYNGGDGLTYPDTTPPYFIDINNISMFNNQSLGYDINASDETGFSCFDVNDTVNFNINCSGYLTNITGLSIGIYYINITINDTSNNLNSAEIFVNVSEYNPLVINILSPIQDQDYIVPYVDLKWTYTGIPSSCSYSLDDGVTNNTEIWGENECYQETANVSNGCGGLSSGSYALGTGTTAGVYQVNYTKPTNATTSTKWLVKHGTLPVYNITIGDNANATDCWNTFPNHVALGIVSIIDIGSKRYSYPVCWNDVAWKSIGQLDFAGSPSAGNTACVDGQPFDEDWDTFCFFDTSVWESVAGELEAYVYEEAIIWDSGGGTGRNVTITDLTTGDYTLDLYCKGSEGQDQVNFSVQINPPDVNLNTPLNASHIDQATNLTASLYDANGVQNATLYIRNLTDDTLINQTTIEFSSTPTTVGAGVVVNLTNGEYYWYYSASDILGDTNTSSNRTLISDIIDPLITWYNPIQFTIPRTTNPTFQINASIFDTYLDAINVTILNEAGTVTYNNFTDGLLVDTIWAMDIITLNEGNNTIEVCARDSLEESPVIEGFANFTKTNAEETLFEMPDGNVVTREIVIKDALNNKLSAESVNLVTTEVFVDGGRHYKTTWEIDDISDGYLEIVMYDVDESLELLMDRGVIRVVDKNRNYYWRYDDMSEAGFDVEYTYVEEEGKVEIKVTKGSYVSVGGRWIIDPIVGGLNNICKNETVILDTTAPEGESGGYTGGGTYTGTGTTPVNASFTNISGTNFTVNVSDPSQIANITLIVKNESDDIINVTTVDVTGYSATEIFFGIVYYLWYEGIYKWSFQVYDTLANLLTTTEAQITYDITEPSGAITYPLNISYNATITNMNFSFVEANPHNCWYNAGGSNVSIPCGDNATGLSSSEGSNTWYFWINDSVGYINESSVTFIQDTIAPVVTIHSPINTIYNTSEFLVNISTNDPTANIFYSSDEGSNYTTYTSEINITLIDGDYIFDVFANDTVNNIGTAQVNFTIDTILPVVVISGISNESTDSFPVNADVNYSITDTNINTCWYVVDGNLSITTFNNSLTEENLTFSGNENITRYLSVPEGTDLAEGRLNITGLNTVVECLQETATSSHPSDGSCNQNYSGNYWFQGSWQYPTINLYDGNYSTFNNPYWGNGGVFYMNYTKPNNTELVSATWQVRDVLGYSNLTIDGVCFNQSDDLYLRVSSENSVSSFITYYCWNGTDWMELLSKSLVSQLYEESILWNEFQYIENISLSIGNENIWSYEGELNLTEETENFASTLNNYLNSTYLIGTNYIVPFKFHSDTSGVLKYSNIRVTDGTTGSINCNLTNTIIPIYSEGLHNITIYGQDTIGWIGQNSLSNYILFHNYTQTGLRNTTMEGVIGRFNLTVKMTDTWETSAFFVYDGEIYPSDSVTLVGGDYIFTKYLTIPDGSGNSTGKTTNWYWNYSIEGNSYWVENYSTTTQNQTVYSLEADDCSSYNNSILNMSLYDEGNVTLIEAVLNPKIEIDLSLRSFLDDTEIWVFNNTWNNNTGQVCLQTELLNNTNFRIDFTIGYSADNYVKEFYYMDNGTLLDNSTNFNSYTTNNIGLYDLLATDSTTFLFEFINADGLPVDEAIVHTYRKYIGEGIYREVERSKQDESGETHVHLVEEDEIYYFVITDNGRIIYTSSTYNAKCLSLPCLIELDAQPEGLDFVDDWDNFAGGSYSISSNDETDKVKIEFVSEEVVEVTLTLYRMDMNYATGIISPVLVSSNTVTATAGTVELDKPVDCEQYFASAFMDGEFTKSEWIDTCPPAKEVFGLLGVLLTALIVIALVLMTITEGVPMVIFLLLALAVAGIMRLMDMSWLAFISISIAGILIIIKLANRRRVQ